MIELRVLGTIDLRRTDGSDEAAKIVLAQPKRLALLVFLALSHARGYVRRDELLGVFWPEMDEARARRALSQSLYVIRQDLGDEVLRIAGNDNVAVDTDVLWCDAVRFNEALNTGNAEEALALYDGPLLPGFHVGGSHPFDEWIENERSRLQSQAAAAASQLAAEARDRGEIREAIEWRERQLDLAPFDEPAFADLLDLLNTAGDRSRALIRFQEFSQRLQNELDLEPSPELVEILEEAKAPNGQAPWEKSRVMASPPEEAPLREGALPPAPDRHAPRSSRTRAFRPVVWAVGLGVTVATLGWMGVFNGPGAREGPTTIGIGPFTIEGDSSDLYLRGGMIDLLTAKLNSAPELVAVDLRDLGEERSNEDPLRAALDAGMHFLIGGSISRGRDGLVIRAQLREVGATDRIVREATVEGDPSELLDLVDDLAARLLSGGLGDDGSLQLQRLASVTTDSHLALRYYLEAERERRRRRLPTDLVNARYEESRALLERAVSVDSTFALAWYRLGAAREQTGDPEGSTEAVRTAARHSQNLPEPYPRLVRAALARSNGEVDRAEAILRSILAQYPELAEAHWQLGDLLLHANRFRGRSVAEAKSVLAEAVRRDPYYEATLHLIQMAIMEGETRRADSLVTLAVPEDASLHWHALTAVGTPREGEALARLRDGHWRESLVAGFWLSEIGQMDLARLLLRDLSAESLDRAWEASRLFHLALLEAGAGRPEAALDVLDRMARVDPRVAAETRAFLVLLPTFEGAVFRFEDAHRALQEAPPEHWVVLFRGSPEARNVSRVCLLGRVALAMGRPDLRREQENTLQVLSAGAFPVGDAARDCLLLIQAERILESGGDPEEALRTLERARTRFTARMSVDPVYNRVAQRFLRAELLRQLGREEEALVWYRSLTEWFDVGSETPVRAAAHLAMARILDGRGDLVEAAKHYQTVLRFWRNPEPPLDTEVAAVRARLRELVGSPLDSLY